MLCLIKVGPVLQFRAQHCLKVKSSVLGLLDREKNPQAQPSSEGLLNSCLSTVIPQIHPPLWQGALPQPQSSDTRAVIALCRQQGPQWAFGLGIFEFGGKKISWYLRFCACWVRDGSPWFGFFLGLHTECTRGGFSTPEALRGRVLQRFSSVSMQQNLTQQNQVCLEGFCYGIFTVVLIKQSC